MASFEYKIIKTRRLGGSISLSVNNEGHIVVRAPMWMTKWIIDRFVADKQDWINKQLKRVRTKNPITQKSYVHGESHLYLGQSYELHIKESETPIRTNIELVDNRIEVSLYSLADNQAKQLSIKNSLLSWYLEKGIEIVTERVNIYVKMIGVEYSRISLKKVSSIWGSCSAGNNLTFNRKLILAPLEIIDYVVVHEVSHLVHRNHSSNFWNLVGQFDPEYKTHRKWLRSNHHLLSI